MAAHSGPSARSWWRGTWPLHRQEWLALAVAFVAVVVAFAVGGLLLTRTFAPNTVTDLDVDVAERLAGARSEGRNDVAHWAAFMSGTSTKVVVSVVLVVAVVVRWRRWTEALLITISLVFEASAFIVVTQLVGRSRPDVPRLLDSPVDSSFPSGHVAAATVYLAVVVIVFRHTRAVWARVAAVVVVGTVPVAVGIARMYQGMHFLSDVVAGVVLGLVTLAVCARVLPDRSTAGQHEADQPTGTRSRRASMSSGANPGWSSTAPTVSISNSTTWPSGSEPITERATPKSAASTARVRSLKKSNAATRWAASCTSQPVWAMRTRSVG